MIHFEYSQEGTFLCFSIKAFMMKIVRDSVSFTLNETLGINETFHRKEGKMRREYKLE
jgi:hypothetical protein